MRLRLLSFTFAGALAVAIAVPVLGTGAARADVDDNPTTVDCMGVERGIRNRNGGDRELGAFGAAQADFVQVVQPYGEWLLSGDCPPAP